MPDTKLIFHDNKFFGFSGSVPYDAEFKLPRALTPDEMAELTRKYGIEFQLGLEIHYKTKHIGSYWLFTGLLTPSGTGAVAMPVGRNEWDLKDIYHTHLGDSAVPSEEDIKSLTWRFEQGIQTEAGLIPAGEPIPARVVIYYPNTHLKDYMPNGKYHQPRR